MMTSFFDNLENVTRPISISSHAPDWYKGPVYRPLIPAASIYEKYHRDEITPETYYFLYNRLVLGSLDREQVYKDLWKIYRDDEITLVCFEKRGILCHRHFVSEWFRMYGYDCNELIEGACY